MPKVSGAKDEIKAFVESGEAGVHSEFTVQALKNAAQNMYTAKGKDCPVKIISIDGKTIILNRELVNNSNGTH